MANWTGSYRSTGGTFDSGYIHAEVYVERTDSNTSSSIKVYSRCYATAGVSSSWIKGKASYNQSGQYVSGDEGVNVTVSAGTTTFTSRTFSVTRGTTAKTATCKSYVYGYGGGGMYDGDHDEASMTVTIPALTSYTISYNANGGTGAPGNQTKYYGQNLNLSSTIPTRSGYSFNNWNTQADGSGTTYSAGSSYTVNDNLTLYAQWTVNYVYQDPIIDGISVIRCDSSGQEQNKGTCAKITFNWSVDPTCTGKSYTLKYKETGSTNNYVSFNNLPSLSNSTSGNIEYITPNTISFDINKTYSIEISLTDTFANPDIVTTRYGTIPVSFVTLEFLNGGTGFAIGKSAKIANKVETTLPIKLQSINITDNTSPTMPIFSEKFQFLDNNNNCLGILDSFFDAGGGQYQRLLSQREINNNVYHNAVYLGLTSSGAPYISLLNDANKKAWQKALEPDVLFEGETIPSGTIPSVVSLSSSAENYNHMRVYYRYFDTNKPRSSVEIFEPNGKWANLFIGYAGLNSGLYWPSAVDIYISGTYISRRYSYYTSNSTTTVRTITSGGDNAPIYITRVEAWNDAWW